ncbi:MAG: hypothetical protein RBT69_03375 [Spirochaetia bacterium]|jgi:hypothetical protein|nr:hypothetical protein [Spirochaetia bacterium]
MKDFYIIEQTGAGIKFMTITSRNNIALGIVLLLSFMILFLLAAPFSIAVAEKSTVLLKDFFTYNYIYSLILIIYALAGILSVRTFFYKTNSLEIFFFMLFLLSIIFESSRSFIIILEYLNSPSSYIMFLSRAAYFGKIFGTGALFTSALFSSAIETRKLDTHVIAIVVLSFLLSSSIPLSDNLLQNSYYRPGFFNYFIFSLIFIDILTAIIFLVIFFQKKNREYVLLAISILLITFGRELSFYFSSPVYFTAGIIFMVIGTFLYSGNLHSIYKWY